MGFYICKAWEFVKISMATPIATFACKKWLINFSVFALNWSSQILVGFHVRIINVFGNTKFTLIVMCNLYSVFSCISILKSYKPKLYCSLDDRQTSASFAMC